MLRQAQYESLVTNYDQILSSHQLFLADTKRRLTEWEQHQSLCDLFEKTHVLQPYTEYVSRHPAQLATLATTLTSNLLFCYWLRDTEAREKRDFKVHLERPLRRPSEYYLLAQEMLQYTGRKHADHEALFKVVNTLRLLTEDLAKLASASADTKSPTTAAAAAAATASTTTTAAATAATAGKPKKASF
eukprot:TRINITY_DN3971_c0_g1_i22.p1 TRINITY_DN3971_c0_g1~~TRINITY_DN3971_c0_g1_i22.p1  ORF type:complete len:188 (+),score=83.46 TRINITY_DN3971_c0_g1_i22:198-761(+)